MALPLPAEVLEALENGKSFEAHFEDDKLVVEGVRGIVKGAVSPVSYTHLTLPTTERV